MDNEKHIERIAGKGNPFRVPDGYFDKFNAELMASLPQREPVTRTDKPSRSIKLWRMVASVAACICLVVCGLSIYMSKNNLDGTLNQPIANVNTTEGIIATDTYVEEIIDYAMMDNIEIYAYMAEE